MTKHLVIILFALISGYTKISAGNFLPKNNMLLKLSEMANISKLAIAARDDVVLRLVQPEMHHFPQCSDLLINKLKFNTTTFMKKLRIATQKIAEDHALINQIQQENKTINFYFAPADVEKLGVFYVVIALNCLEILLNFPHISGIDKI